MKEEIKKFMALASLMLPKLLTGKMPDDSDVTEDSAVLEFNFDEEWPIGIVMDMIEDDMELMLLYHGTSKDNSGKHHCCFFSSPTAGRSMYKINVTTDGKGQTSGLTATIYNDIQDFEEGLEYDLQLHTDSFNFIKSMTDVEVIKLFCTML